MYFQFHALVSLEKEKLLSFSAALGRKKSINEKYN